MSKFIKVTDVRTGVEVIILAHRLGGVVPHHESGVIIEGVDGCNWHVKESLEQIESQLLRDEFAKAIATGLSADEGYRIDSIARMSYKIADQMLKERSRDTSR